EQSLGRESVIVGARAMPQPRGSESQTGLLFSMPSGRERELKIRGGNCQARVVASTGLRKMKNRGHRRRVKCGLCAGDPFKPTSRIALWRLMAQATAQRDARLQVMCNPGEHLALRS